MAPDGATSAVMSTDRFVFWAACHPSTARPDGRQPARDPAVASLLDGYISNPRATVVARSDGHGADRKRGCGVAEIRARARGACADPVRDRAPWHGCPNRAGTRRSVAVAATGR